VRTVFFIIMIVATFAMLSPILLEAGRRLGQKYQEIFYGGHDPEKVKELREQDV